MFAWKLHLQTYTYAKIIFNLQLYKHSKKKFQRQTVNFTVFDSRWLWWLCPCWPATRHQSRSPTRTTTESTSSSIRTAHTPSTTPGTVPLAVRGSTAAGGNGRQCRWRPHHRLWWIRWWSVGKWWDRWAASQFWTVPQWWRRRGAGGSTPAFPYHPQVHTGVHAQRVEILHKFSFLIWSHFKLVFRIRMGDLRDPDPQEGCRSGSRR